MSTNVIASAPPAAIAPSRRSFGILELLDANQGLLLVLGLIAAYVPPLTRSLWVDETGTYWMAFRGPLAAIERTSHWPGQSILFAVVTSFFCVDPSSPFRDLVLRLPALLGGAAACWFLYRFAEDIMGRGAGRIAAVLFAFSPSTIELATEARPYTLAMAAAAASCWTLYRWARSRERLWLAAYIVSSTLLIYFHYLFGALFAAHVVFLGFELMRHRRFARGGELLIGYVLIALLTLPLVPHIMLLAHESHTLPFTSRPTGVDLAGALMPPLYTVGAFVSALLVHMARSDERAGVARLTPPAAWMLFVWWAAGPMALFLVTSGTSLQVFALRYVAYSGLALALLLTWVACSAFGPRTALAWVLMLVALVTTGNLLLLAGPQRPDVQEVGPFMKVIRQESAGTGADLPPVLFPSALVESNFYWRPGDSAENYWYAPFAAYPIRNKVLGLPLKLTPDVKAYVDNLLKTDLRDRRKILFAPHDFEWVTWFTERFEKEGFTYRFQQLNAYWVVVFERPAARSQSIDPP